MPKFFISYRREDSLDIAGRIYDRLAAHFGRDDVFLDVDAIPFGVDFRSFLTDWIAGCDVVLVVIGGRWLECRFEGGPKAGQRRLDDPADYVRIEVAAALERKIPVIPVLVGGSSMPSTDQLPSDLSGLVFRNAAEVRSGRDFHVHMDRLIRGLEHLPPLAPPPKSIARKKREPTPPPRRKAPPPGAGPPAQELANSIGMVLVLIQPGEFTMGSPDLDKDAFEREKPQHHVRITTPFYLGRYQVTQDQYQQVMGENPSRFKGDEQLPVEQVSWFDAVAFCNKLSEQEKLVLYYKVAGQEVTILGGDGYHLPTDAEWEYACRAGTTTRYYFGDDAVNLGEYAWYDKNAGGQTHPVGQKVPNAWGLYDMLGNVWEWCWDGFDTQYYRQSPAADPPGPVRAAVRVIRGGSWGRYPRYARSADRPGLAPGYRDYSLGFRVARVLSGK